MSIELLALRGLMVAGALAAAYFGGVHHANERHEFKRLQAVEAAREKEANWQSDVEVLTNVHQAELARVAAARDAAVRELRNRPDRMPAAATAACAGSTGAELSRPDAEFLAGEAARADSLAADLGTCRAWIETVTKDRP